MDGDGPSELRASNDRGWQKLGPHDGPRAAGFDELPEPAKWFFQHECAVLNSRFGELEEEITELKRFSALQLSHSASASQQPQDVDMAHRVVTLEEAMRDLRINAASQTSHSAAALPQPQDDAMAHRVATLEEAIRDLKTSVASQPSHSAAALQQTQDDAMAHRVGTLEQQVIDLREIAAWKPNHSASASQQPQNDDMAHRVGALEAQMRDLKNTAALQPSHSASASQQPEDDAMAASCASASLPQKRKTCPKYRVQYRVPVVRPSKMNSGQCQWCQRSWSTAEFDANYQMDRNVWEQAMSDYFIDFKATPEHLAGGLWDFNEGSVGTPYHVETSLVVGEALTTEQGRQFARLMAERLWQPDQGDDKCWFLFKGGQKANRYITFGCVRCQRCTDLYYGSPSFWTDFMRFFP